MIQFTGVQKSYGAKPILDIPSLSLPSGIYWLQGANGSGKTTLLRMLAGISPFTGTITVEGHNLRNNPVAYRRSVAWADAEPLYPDFLTGEDLLCFYQDIQRPQQQQVGELIDQLGVSTWLSSRARSWSAGMCKKVSLLLAFLGQATVITLDEPLVTLDQPGVAALFTLILERHRQAGTSFILSSHQDLGDVPFPIYRLTLIENSIQLD